MINRDYIKQYEPKVSEPYTDKVMNSRACTLVNFLRTYFYENPMKIDVIASVVESGVKLPKDFLDHYKVVTESYEYYNRKKSDGRDFQEYCLPPIVAFAHKVTAFDYFHFIRRFYIENTRSASIEEKKTIAMLISYTDAYYTGFAADSVNGKGGYEVITLDPFKEIPVAYIDLCWMASDFCFPQIEPGLLGKAVNKLKPDNYAYIIENSKFYKTARKLYTPTMSLLEENKLIERIAEAKLIDSVYSKVVNATEPRFRYPYTNPENTKEFQSMRNFFGNS